MQIRMKANRRRAKFRAFVVSKLWPFLAGASSAVIMLLAFFIPSLQDQWDRYQSRKVIQQYVEMGDDFMNNQNYKMAEEAFTKAWEFSEMKRLDVEVKRLSAKVNRIYQDPVWGSEPPEGLEEVDFEFLLQFQKGTEHTKARASILTSYGIYLASTEKPMEAEKALLEAIQLNSKDVLAYINLGNLMDQVGKKEEAEKAYQKSILLDPTNSKAHYNLGLLYAEQGKLIEAEMELTQAIELDSTEEDAKQELDLIRKEINEGKK